MSLKVGLVGLGTIARAQHIPAIAATPGIELAAVASRNASLPDVPSYPDVKALLAAEPGVNAISLCTPPLGRFDQAYAALAAGRHVMLEKPPGASVSEVLLLERFAAGRGLTIFATWHSRHAAAVERAHRVLAARTVRSMTIEWREDVRRWHPGQEWIWQPGGLGVFDPGINALSIATRIMPEPFFLERAELGFPKNRETPIVASLAFRTPAGVPVTAEFDWRQEGGQTWTITVETDQGVVLLENGGSKLTVDGTPMADFEDIEYRSLYARFVELVAAGKSEMDISPLVHVADAFMLGRRYVTEAFFDPKR